MEVPRWRPAPVVRDHAAVFRAWCDHQGQAGLSALVDRADGPCPTSASRRWPAAPRPRRPHQPRAAFSRRPPGVRPRSTAAVAETCGRRPHPSASAAGSHGSCWMRPSANPWGASWTMLARHDHHGDGPDPPAHHPVTSYTSVAPGDAPGAGASIAAMKHGPRGQPRWRSLGRVCSSDRPHSTASPAHARPGRAPGAGVSGPA